ncbi:MAG: hypothetical protein ACRDDA_03295 [Aeromonas sp.]
MGHSQRHGSGPYRMSCGDVIALFIIHLITNSDLPDWPIALSVTLFGGAIADFASNCGDF